MASETCGQLARALTEQAGPLTAEWAREVAERLGIDPAPYLHPEDPHLIRGVAQFLADAATGTFVARTLVDLAGRMGETAETGGVLPEQIFDAYLILDDILWRFASRELERLGSEAPPGAHIRCVHRLHKALFAHARATTGAFFRGYRERIERDTERLQGFNRMVSHELKGPIAAVLGAATLLSGEAPALDPEKRALYTAMIVRNATHMAAVIDDLLALTTAEGAMERPAVRPVALEEVIRRVLEWVAHEAEERGVRVGPATPLPELHVDRRAIELVLVNLVMNGIRYSDPAKQDRYVRVSARPAGEEQVWELAVEDNGIGIPDEAKPHVFERFFRARPEIPGTGLGLGIVKEMVERWGGRVHFVSAEGEGTTFFFTAPGTD